MSDRRIILNFLALEYPDNHPIIYIYVCGQKRSEMTAIEKIMNFTSKIFCPPLSEFFVLGVVKDYLSEKKKLYKEGKIKVVSHYNQPNDAG